MAKINKTDKKVKKNKKDTRLPVRKLTEPQDEQSLAEAQKQLAFEKQQLEIEKLRREEEEAEQNRKQRALSFQRQEAELEMTLLSLADARRRAATAEAEDAEQREYLFFDGVSTSSCKQAIDDLNVISRRFPNEPITIVINSPGGRVIDGLALFDHINELRANGHHVTVKVRGMAASMGGILLQAGDERVVGKHARVLIHEVSAGTIGRVNDMTDDLEDYTKLWKTLSEILAERSSMTAKQIRKKAHKFDWWLSADEAVALGFADRVG